METTAAKNYLENTNLKFKFKAGAAIGTAAYLLILVLIVVAAIFVITYVAHDRGSSMCSGCHGDCANCGKKPKKEE